MIRINLLGVPKARGVKRKSEFKLQVALGGAFIGLVLVLCGYFLFALDGRLTQLQNEKGAAEKKLSALKEKVKEVENFEVNKKALEEKNKIIEQLKRNQSGPVHLLDEVSKSLNPIRVWLVSMTAKSNAVDIEGKAITNADLVEFINNLRMSRYFANIELVESRQVNESNVPIYDFKLKCSLVL